MFSVHDCFELLGDSVCGVLYAHSQGWKLGLKWSGVCFWISFTCALSSEVCRVPG